MKTVEELQSLISKEIADLELTRAPQNLYEPIAYILSLGGKRLRPLLVLLAHQIKRPDNLPPLRPALAVELFHNFTLIHDDIMDQAPLRRGHPTVHRKWNEPIAILSGDTMLVKTYDMLLEADHSVVPGLVRRFNQIAIEVCEGQQVDMDFERESTVSESDYIEMISRKTAVLLAFSLELGGILAGCDDESVQKLHQLGLNMGIGFQLMDDYLDVYGEKATFGKQVGGDIIANKKTFPLIQAMSKASGSHQEILSKYLGDGEFDPLEKVQAVKEVYDDLGISNFTRSKMDVYFNKAFSILDEIDGDENGKEILKNFIHQLINREN